MTSEPSSGDETSDPKPDPTTNPPEDQLAALALSETDAQANGVASFESPPLENNNHNEIENEEEAAAAELTDSALTGEVSSRSRGGGTVWARTNSELEAEAPESPSSSGYAGGRGSSSASSDGSGIDEIAEVRDDDDQVVDGVSDSQAPWVPGKRHVDEDDASISWRKRKKHFFILSNAGKPIYSRHGDEHKLAGFSATLQAIISFVENGGDCVKLVRAGNHQVVFLVKGPIYLVCISCTEEPYESLRMQLELIYGQMLLILTKSVNRCFVYATRQAAGAILHLPSPCLCNKASIGAILQDVADSGVLS